MRSSGTHTRYFSSAERVRRSSPPPASYTAVDVAKRAESGATGMTRSHDAQDGQAKPLHGRLTLIRLGFDHALTARSYMPSPYAGGTANEPTAVTFTVYTNSRAAASACP